MKSVIMFSTFALISWSSPSFACTYETIDLIVSKINPYETASVTASTRNALNTLKLCDENLEYAGRKIGGMFNSYETTSTAYMAQIVSSEAPLMSEDMSQGLGLGMIEKLNLYELSSSQWMMSSIYDLAKSHPALAKIFALELMKKSNPYEEEAEAYLQKTVAALTTLSSVSPPVDGGSIWTFKSQSQTCTTYPGPWGTYYECPQYSASVSDLKGNRIVLTCQSQNAGIEMQIRMASVSVSQVNFASISGLSFGTDSLIQAMGIPYQIPQARTLIAEEVLSTELLNALRSDKNLRIGIRSQSGEKNFQMTFPLSGSNIAIQKLMQVCQ